MLSSYQLHDTWPEVFVVNNKNLPYEHYRHMAVCSLPQEQKDALRAWG